MAIQVIGATLIGTAKGYDVFDITTYTAAQEFINLENNTPAGQHFTQSQTTFDEHIRPDRLHLYFFVIEDTNGVKYAIIKGANQGLSEISIGSGVRTQVELNVNFNLEDTAQHSKIMYNDTIPLYLIPNISIDEVIDENGCYFEDDELIAVLPQFCRHDVIANLTLPPRIHIIDAHAFKYGQKIHTLVLDDNIERIPANTITSDIAEVGVVPLETPSTWSDGWNRGHEAVTQFGYGLSDADRAEMLELIAAREAEIAEREAREAAARAEAERIEAERLAREQALAAEREARKIRYKVVGDEITVTGTRKGITELTIPAEIDGKPVTKIEPYAFFDNQDLRRLSFPDTIKEVGRGATLQLDNLRAYIRVPDSCLIGKDNPNVRHRSNY